MKNKRCEECANCLPIGEGDHICDKTNKLVIEEYIPTGDYGCCRGDKQKMIDSRADAMKNADNETCYPGA